MLNDVIYEDPADEAEAERRERRRRRRQDRESGSWCSRLSPRRRAIYICLGTVFCMLFGLMVAIVVLQIVYHSTDDAVALIEAKDNDDFLKATSAVGLVSHSHTTPPLTSPTSPSSHLVTTTTSPLTTILNSNQPLEDPSGGPWNGFPKLVYSSASSTMTVGTTIPVPREGDSQATQWNPGSPAQMPTPIGPLGQEGSGRDRVGMRPGETAGMSPGMGPGRSGGMSPEMGPGRSPGWSLGITVGITRAHVGPVGSPAPPAPSFPDSRGGIRRNHPRLDIWSHVVMGEMSSSKEEQTLEWMHGHSTLATEMTLNTTNTSSTKAMPRTSTSEFPIGVLEPEPPEPSEHIGTLKPPASTSEFNPGSPMAKTPPPNGRVLINNEGMSSPKERLVLEGMHDQQTTLTPSGNITNLPSRARQSSPSHPTKAPPPGAYTRRPPSPRRPKLPSISGVGPGSPRRPRPTSSSPHGQMGGSHSPTHSHPDPNQRPSPPRRRTPRKSLKCRPKHLTSDSHESLDELNADYNDTLDCPVMIKEYRAQLKDIMLYLLMSLFGLGVVMVVITVIAVKVLDARKRGGCHCCGISCYPCCDRNVSSSPDRQRTPTPSMSAQVQVELRMNDLQRSNSENSASSDGSISDAAERNSGIEITAHSLQRLAAGISAGLPGIDQQRTCSVDTNVSDPPSYNEAMGIDASGIIIHSISAEIPGQNVVVWEPPSYEEVISSGAALP